MLRTSKPEKLASKPPLRLNLPLALVRDQPPTSNMELLNQRNRHLLVTIEDYRVYPYISYSHLIIPCHVVGGCLLGTRLEVAAVVFSQGPCPNATTQPLATPRPGSLARTTTIFVSP
jgi:hypothetical protein